VNVGGIDTDRRVLVIAEIGNNHEGSYTLAEEMIGLAARAGADAVKFQTIVPERLVAPSQAERIRQLRRFQLTPGQFEDLSEVARREGVLFLSTPFDVESAAFLDPLVPAFKIASGDNNFFPLLEAVARTGKPVLVSSGLAGLDGIAATRDFLRGVWRREGIPDSGLAVLHCVTSYPTPPGEANLLAIRELRTLGVTPGYSDHTLGIEAAVLSVALGARVIEKHFTIDKNRSGFRDHQLSADPEDLARLVERVREAEVLLGDGGTGARACEAAALTAARRSIVARRDLPKGAVLAWEDLDWLRPGGGLSPGREGDLLGKTLARDIPQGEMIRIEDVAAAP
jgi:N,N'-diacetyllegionaminate synthase